MTRPARPSLFAHLRGVASVFAGLAIAALSAVLLAWLFRIQIAGLVLERWCGARDLACSARIEQLGFDGIVATGLEVRTQSGAPLMADALKVGLAWPGFLSPQVTSLNVSRPRVRARFDGDAVDLYGLEAVVPRQGGGDRRETPELVARNGELVLATPAGPVTAGFTLDAKSLGEARARLSLLPARLASDGQVLDWSRGELDITVRNGRAVGSADLQIQHAQLGGLSIRAADLTANIAPQADGSDLSVSLAGDVASVRHGQSRLDGAQVTGQARMGRLSPARGLAELETLVRHITIDLTCGTVVHDGMSAGAAQFQGEMARGPDGDLAGPVALTLDEALTPALSARRVSASGKLTRSRAGGVAFSGPLVLEDARVSRETRAGIRRLVTLPEPLDAHGAAIAEGISVAAKAFKLGLALEANRSRQGDWRLSARRATALSAESGLSLGIEPFGMRPWLEMDGDALSLSGRVTLSGGGLPSLSGELDEARFTPEGHVARIRATTLAPWREHGLELALDLKSARLIRTADGQRIDLDGEVLLDGPMGGANVSNGRIYGALEASHGAEGWRMQTRRQGCLGVKADAVSRKDLTVGPLALGLCPADGRVFRQRGGGLEGRFTLERLDLPMRLGATAAFLEVANMSVDWNYEIGFRGDIAMTGLTVRLDREGRPVEIRATTPSATIATVGRFPSLDLRLGATALEDPSLPVDVSLDALSLSARALPGGPEAEIMAEGVQVRDTHIDPVFQPLRLDLTGQLRGDWLHVRGPVQLDRQGVAIGDLDADLRTDGSAGSGSVTSRRLAFEPGGLQPHHVSERLRGYFTGASGSVSARADLDLSEGKLAARGRLDIADFSFQTLAFGRVEGVDGEIVFDDLLKLSTPPVQTVRIGRINPGIPLENGVVRFHLDGGREARLEAANWPFAGGSISVAPAAWLLADPERTLTVRAERVDLATLTERVDAADLEASGTVSGRFPIVFKGSSARIEDARLVADKGGGHLKYTGAVAERARAANAFADYAFRALEDLDFSILELAADGDLNGTILATVSLRGHNPAVLDGAEFEFDISIDSPLMGLIKSRDRVLGTDWISGLQVQTTVPEGSP